MIVSLANLKDTLLYEYDSLDDVFEVYDTDELVDKIQTEIDRYYLPRPLFEDGEPAQCGDEYIAQHETKRISEIRYCIDGGRQIISTNGDYHFLDSDRCLERPPEPDTQEKIDADAKRIACKMMNESDYVAEVMDLLARQRKLDRVE